MKKLLAILALSACIISCNGTTSTDIPQGDSARAAAIADSFAAANTAADTALRYLDSTTIKADSSMKPAAAGPAGK